MEFGTLGEPKPLTDGLSISYEEAVDYIGVLRDPTIPFEWELEWELANRSEPGFTRYLETARVVEGFGIAKERLMQNHLFEPKHFKYDVFISNAEDTRSGFAGYLEIFLTEMGYSICKDNSEGFEKSRIVIVVFSEDYASAPSYLDELTKIKKLAKTNGILILPVFYHVSPAEVRYQQGSYGEALAAHENYVLPETLEEWIKTMKEVANIVGWHIERSNKKFEFEYIEEILQVVSKRVACSVGLYTRVQEVGHCLDSKSDGVCVVVICGDSGMGKSTLAREVYNQNACNKFDYCSFVDKAGEYSSIHGLKCLLCKIVGENNIESEHVKEVLKQKKIFSIVEDIFDLEQLEAIVEQTSSLASGSKVILTARDCHLLKIPGIDKIYEMKKFDNTEAYELLCLKMFKSRHVKANFVSIIKRVVTYASGLPFVLEVIGSTLAGKEKKECELLLDKYEMIPNEDTREILKVGFDALGERLQEMLIHIAHHLKDKDLKVVEDKLHMSFGGCPRKDIKVLLDKSLIKINEHGQVTLHDLTLAMVKDQ